MLETENEYKKLLENIYNDGLTLSYSSLKQFYNTPRSFIKYKLKKFEKSPAMIMGSLLDCLILTPENLEKDFIVLDSAPSTDNQKNFVKDYLELGDIEVAFANNYKRGDAEKTFESLRDYIEAVQTGKDIISQDTLDKAKSISESVLSNPTAIHFLEQAVSFQEKLEWEQDGFKHVGFLDVRGKGFIMDLKYRGKGSDVEEFQWDFKKLHYDLQSGMYMKAAEILELPEVEKYYIMAYDNSGDVSVIEIDKSYLIYGQAKHNLILQEFKRCMSENLWQSSHDFYGYNQGVHTLVKPRFASLKKPIDE